MVRRWFAGECQRRRQNGEMFSHEARGEEEEEEEEEGFRLDVFVLTVHPLTLKMKRCGNIFTTSFTITEK